MRRFLTISALVVAGLAAASAPALAQQLPQPPQGFQPPRPPPIKPYKPVAAKPAGPYEDASLQAFLKALGTAAQRKDRAALAKLVVAQGFFWIQDKDLADKSKSGIDNFAKAIGLDAKDGAGWDILANDANDPTAAEVPQHKGLVCAPAPPAFDPKAMDALLQQTGTEPTDWAYPLDDGIEVRAAAQPKAPVVGKLGLYFVHVLFDAQPPDDPAEQMFVHVALPSGKTGFVTIDSMVPLVTDQICYSKDPSGWKIAGYIGGNAP